MDKHLKGFLHDIVRASNAIEDIYAEPGESLFDDHLTAVEYSRRAGRLVSPHQIHRVLMRRNLADAGKNRKSHMSLVNLYTDKVSATLPRPELVPFLLDEYIQLQVAFFKQFRAGEFSDKKKLENRLFEIHAHGLCIHPFSDGNGRTFRIYWNQLRLRCDLGWLVVIPPDKVDEKVAIVKTVKTGEVTPTLDYTGLIRQYEIEIFKPKYPDVY